MLTKNSPILELDEKSITATPALLTALNWILFKGIYRSIDLRAGLVATGFKFNSQST